MPEVGGKVSYAMEGGVFDTIGDIPTVIIGADAIEQARTPDEYVEIAQLAECLGAPHRLVTP